MVNNNKNKDNKIRHNKIVMLINKRWESGIVRKSKIIKIIVNFNNKINNILSLMGMIIIMTTCKFKIFSKINLI